MTIALFHVHSDKSEMQVEALTKSIIIRPSAPLEQFAEVQPRITDNFDLLSVQLSGGLKTPLFQVIYYNGEWSEDEIRRLVQGRESSGGELFDLRPNWTLGFPVKLESRTF
jgi:hypothetical protein